MGSNKSFLRFAKNPNASEEDIAKQYADFVKGNDNLKAKAKV